MLQTHKAKTCRQCGALFTPMQPMQRVCGLSCALAQSRTKQAKIAEKATRADLRERKEKLKTKSQWLREAQTAFNSYIRARDKGKPCISSGRMEQDRFTGGHFDAGHYRSTGAAAHLRFCTWNCHAQSKHDNRDLSGNIVEYRKRLIDRIGLDRVEALENDNSIRKFDIEYLKRVKRIFTKRARITNARFDR